MPVVTQYHVRIKTFAVTPRVPIEQMNRRERVCAFPFKWGIVRFENQCSGKAAVTACETWRVRLHVPLVSVFETFQLNKNVRQEVR